MANTGTIVWAADSANRELLEATAGELGLGMRFCTPRDLADTAEKGRDRLVPTGRTFVAVDTLGAGIDEMVLICQGSSARLTPETEKLPIDAVVIGLVDCVDLGGQTIFSSRGSL